VFVPHARLVSLKLFFNLFKCAPDGSVEIVAFFLGDERSLGYFQRDREAEQLVFGHVFHRVPQKKRIPSKRPGDPVEVCDPTLD
jgi:hypothetical protein